MFVIVFPQKLTITVFVVFSRLRFYSRHRVNVISYYYQSSATVLLRTMFTTSCLQFMKYAIRWTLIHTGHRHYLFIFSRLVLRTRPNEMQPTRIPTRVSYVLATRTEQHISVVPNAYSDFSVGGKQPGSATVSAYGLSAVRPVDFRKHGTGRRGVPGRGFAHVGEFRVVRGHGDGRSSGCAVRKSRRERKQSVERKQHTSLTSGAVAGERGTGFAAFGTSDGPRFRFTFWKTERSSSDTAPNRRRAV